MIRLGTIVGSEFIFGLWPRWVELTAAQMNTHKHVLGTTGTGKSKLLESLFLQSLRDNIPTSFIDPTGRSCDYILSYLVERGFFDDPNNYHKLLYIEFADNDYFFPLNILKIPWASESETAQIVVEAFMRAYPEIAEGAALFYKMMDAGIKVSPNTEKRPPVDTSKTATEGQVGNQQSSVTPPFVHVYERDQWASAATPTSMAHVALISGRSRSVGPSKSGQPVGRLVT